MQNFTTHPRPTEPEALRVGASRSHVTIPLVILAALKLEPCCSSSHLGEWVHSEDLRHLWKTHWLCRSCYALKRIHTQVCKPVSGLDQALTSLVTLGKYRNPVRPSWLLHSYQRKSCNSSGSKAQSALHTSEPRVRPWQTQNLPLLLHWAHKHLEDNGFFQFPEQGLHLWVCKVHPLPSGAASNMGLSCILMNILELTKQNLASPGVVSMLATLPGELPLSSIWPWK